MEKLELYTYCKSSAAYRVRIALNYKGIEYTSHYINLLADGGDNFKPDYMDINPQGLIPTLVNGDIILQQSLSILEYLEETWPQPPLLPVKPEDRGYVRAIAQMIACEIHPLNNLRVLSFLENNLNLEVKNKLVWYRHWIKEGFTAIESFLEKHNKVGQFCFGNTPSIADACLVPQVYNANRYECDLSNYPIIRGINEHCMTLPAIIQAAPENQKDFVR